jgi:predicted enzyme related to lactoylglutathione lyase/extradiol dioxygenase family protein
MDLWRAEQFYTQALDGLIFIKAGMRFEDNSGFDHPPASFIKFGRQHIGFFLQRKMPVHPPAAVEQGYPCWGFFVAQDDFDDVAQRVKAAGGRVGAVRTKGYGRVRMKSLRCTDTEGNCLELVADPRGRFNGQSVTGLSHVHFEALDLSETAAFYKQYLGVDVADSDEEADWIALGLPSGQHLFFHRVATLSPATVGPYTARHFAFFVDDGSWHTIVDRLHAAGIDERDIVPGIRAPEDLDTYFSDPNQHLLQIKNSDSAAAAAGKPRLRYVAA